MTGTSRGARSTATTVANEDEEVTFDVTVERVIYRAEDTGFSVLSVVTGDVGDASAERSEFAAVGRFVEVAPGVPLRLRGSWVTSPRYGVQLQVAGYQLREPSTLAGIKRYLGSGVVPGIGPELAGRIVAHFGLDTFDVAERTPERLAEVSGIGAERREAIARALVERRDAREALVFLYGIGVTPGIAARIVKKHGGKTEDVVRANPYGLAEEVWGIGWAIADGIASQLGVARDADERVDAGVLHALERAADEGHVHLSDDEVAAWAGGVLGLPRSVPQARLEPMSQLDLVVRELLGARWCSSLPRLHAAESAAARDLARVATSALAPLRTGLDADVGDAGGVALSPQQRDAVVAALESPLSVVTGGPGVGKTTVIRAVAALAERAGLRVELVAPTGRAARRMTEASGRPASTIHRLLGFRPGSDGSSFVAAPSRSIQAGLLVVDEASMIDVHLLGALLAAVRPGTRVVLVGDVDQLPSVGPGAVLADVIESGVARVCRLTEIFRQAAESRIVRAAHAVNRGRIPDLSDPPEGEGSDFHFVSCDDPRQAAAVVADVATRWIPEQVGIARGDVQVLSPMHRGDLGTGALNRAIQGVVNPPRDGVPVARRGDYELRPGDRVLQSRNDYGREVSNGDVGVVRHVADDGRSVTASFDGRPVEYRGGEVDQLALAYAISVHKSQGSEYPAVVVPVSSQHRIMLNRQLLYTALTRGKRLVVLVGDRRAIEQAVRTTGAGRRNTWLAQRTRDFAGDARGARGRSSGGRP